MRNDRFYLPYETRDDDPPQPGIEEAVAAVTELRTATEQFRTTQAAELKKLGERLDGIETKIARPTATQTKDEAKELERKAFNGFLRHGREALQPEEVRALRVADDPAGGYLALPEFSTEVIRLLTQFSPVRAAARIGQTGMGSVIIPKRTAITAALWEGEIEEAEESEPAFSQVEIPVHGMRTYTDISQQLLEDAAVNVEAELSDALAEDFGKKEGIAFLNGTGVKQPRGIMVHPDLGFTKNGHNTTLSADALIDLFHALPAAYRNNGAWMMNSTTLATVRKLKNASSGDYLWRESIAEGNPSTILGRPVIDAVDMPDVASQSFPIVFGDFNQAYRIYDRISLAILRDPYTQAKKSLVRFHARRRTGGDVVKAEAIRKLKMAT